MAYYYPVKSNKKYNLSMTKSANPELVEDISFESSVVRRMNELQANSTIGPEVVINDLTANVTSVTTTNSDIIVTEGTFSNVLPMDEPPVPAPATRSSTSRPSTSRVAEPSDSTSSSEIVITEGTFSNVLPMDNPPDVNADEVVTSLPGSSRMAAPAPTPSSASRGHLEESQLDDEWPTFEESQLLCVPDFSTAITSTPRRNVDDEEDSDAARMVIDLGLIRRTAILEKQLQIEQARRWYLRVKDTLKETSKPYARTLKTRKETLSKQIEHIYRQREALDKVLTSLEKESRDVEDQISYLETFTENFPTFPR